MFLVYDRHDVPYLNYVLPGHLEMEIISGPGSPVMVYRVFRPFCKLHQPLARETSISSTEARAVWLNIASRCLFE